MANKVLMIDDDPEFVEAISNLLDAKGYEVHTASNGKDGVAKAKAENPDIILLDVMMTTKHEGFDTAREMHEPRLHAEQVHPRSVDFLRPKVERCNEVSSGTEKPGHFREQIGLTVTVLNNRDRGHSRESLPLVRRFIEVTYFQVRANHRRHRLQSWVEVNPM